MVPLLPGSTPHCRPAPGLARESVIVLFLTVRSEVRRHFEVPGPLRQMAMRTFFGSFPFEYNQFILHCQSSFPPLNSLIIHFLGRTPQSTFCLIVLLAIRCSEPDRKRFMLSFLGQTGRGLTSY